MHIRLEIEANSPQQLRNVLAEILDAGVVASATEFSDAGEDAVPSSGLPIFNGNEAPPSPANAAPEKPKGRGKKAATTEAAAASPATPPSSAPDGASAGETSSGETTGAGPAATTAASPSDAPPPPPPPPPPAPAVAGEITVDSLRNLMASVMAAAPAGKGVPASTVQAALKAACGGIGSIAQLVPEQYSNAHAALSAL